MNSLSQSPKLLALFEPTRELVRVENGKIVFPDDLTLDEAKQAISTLIKEWVFPISVWENGHYKECSIHEVTSLSLSALQEGPTTMESRDQEPDQGSAPTGAPCPTHWAV